MAKKMGKIPLAATFGAFLTASKLASKWFLYDNDTDRPVRNNLMLYHMTGYADETAATALGVTPGFYKGEAIGTWAPAVGGALISTYVGGPKGLNMNAKIKGIPLVKW